MYLKDDRDKTHLVYCVNMAPNVFPIAAPRGAPAANVANAMDRIFDGGNECARIPSYKIRLLEVGTLVLESLHTLEW